MDLKTAFEELRGQAIGMKLPVAEIPCIETSDGERLCRCPVVSVHMITYNHESYIREAIEGVMMQQTDFEFELIIGEDCSQDKTREICFEYQKRYPDKIRVLWWHENVTKFGGNSRRVFARCRGEFIAFCEGDDYWTDPHKLQKQVSLIRQTGAVGCVSYNDILHLDGSVEQSVYPAKRFITSRDYFDHYFHTSTYVYQRALLLEVQARYALPYWYDTMLFHCMASHGQIALLPEVTSVRRITGAGAATSLNVTGRFRLNFSQFFPMYLWGPRVLRRRYGVAILNALSYCLIFEARLDDDFRAKRRMFERLFWRFFFRYCYLPQAWVVFVRRVVYRFGLKRLH